MDGRGEGGEILSTYNRSDIRLFFWKGLGLSDQGQKAYLQSVQQIAPHYSVPPGVNLSDPKQAQEQADAFQAHRKGLETAFDGYLRDYNERHGDEKEFTGPLDSQRVGLDPQAQDSSLCCTLARPSYATRIYTVR